MKLNLSSILADIFGTAVKSNHFANWDQQSGGPQPLPLRPCRFGARRSIRRAAALADGKFVRC